MREKAVAIKADIGERVRVPDLECSAVILALYVGRYCTTYEIAYFHGGERKTAYVYDHEFSVTPPPPPTPPTPPPAPAAP